MRSPAVVLVVLVGVACDAPSQPPPSESPPPVESQPSEPEPDEVPSEPSEPTPSEPPKPVGGPHCDQRELADESGAPMHRCIDFTGHTGVTEVRCFAGAELREGTCPSSDIVASCVLSASGVKLLHYQGASLADAQTSCEAMGGLFAQAVARPG